MVNSSRRRLLATGGSCLALGLGGCAGGDIALAPPPDPSGGALLTPWLNISGGWRVNPQQQLPVPRVTGGRINFVQPVGVAVE